MNLEELDYSLPSELIAQNPVSPRDHSKLMVLDRQSGRITHQIFYNIINYLQAGDLLILNDSMVIPARLLGKNESTGGKIEILLNRENNPGCWEVIGKNLKVGKKIIFADSNLSAIVTKRLGGTFLLNFNLQGEEFFNEIEKIGSVPLPPYIRHGQAQKKDKLLYQTTFACEKGSVAAPTAGLHFTKELLEKIRNKSIEIAKVTLHVGLGTFLPIKSEDITKHQMHEEYFEIKAEVLEKIKNAKIQKRRIISVGTTSTRVLESVCRSYPDYNFPAKDLFGLTDIFIYPGFKFRCIDGLITNFHLSKSTLLLLVSAFAGKEKIFNAYKEAVLNNYRFYSYGDAMFIV